MPIYCLILHGATLIYGGIVDYQKREIPNLVPILLLLSGSISGTAILPRIIVMLMVAVLLLIASKLSAGGIPGGDFKLLCALTFACGLFGMLATLFAAGFGALLVSLLLRQPVKRNIPLCTYVAGAYIVVCACLLIL